MPMSLIILASKYRFDSRIRLLVNPPETLFGRNGAESADPK
jgi:hypothetical protein